MGFKDQLRRLRRDVQKDMVLVKLKDGATRVFADMDVFKEMFSLPVRAPPGQDSPLRGPRRREEGHAREP